MQVSFKLNSQQLTRANVRKQTVSQEKPGDCDVFCGNLGGHVWRHMSLNPDQHLELSGDVMTYKGQRCPLWQDGMISIMIEIIGDENYDSWPVVKYVTSDATLRWHETKEGQMYDRVKAGQINSPEILSILRDFKEFDHPLWVQQVVRTYLQGKSTCPSVGSKAYARAAAEGTLPELLILEKIRKEAEYFL